MTHSMRTQKGVTLIELIIVVMLISVLAAIAIPMYKNSITSSKEAVLKENLFTIRDVIDQFYLDKQKYPQDLEELVDEGYLREVPYDPMTNSQDTWLTDPPPNPEESGVYDVKSGSEEQALDGTYYSEW